MKRMDIPLILFISIYIDLTLHSGFAAAVIHENYKISDLLVDT
jgi:hypothetical protein